MQLIGRDIGSDLDELAADIFKRVRDEAGRELRAEASTELSSISNVRWDEDAVTVQIHEGVPTYALPHVFAIALQHVRQRLDHYPDVRRPEGDQPEGSALLRQALRELVLEPEAEARIVTLHLDDEWERKQRHNALKGLIADKTGPWREAGSPGEQFMALQYARFDLQHPEQMWERLRKQFEKALPGATTTGKHLAALVRAHGWTTPGGCLQSLVAARDHLQAEAIAKVEDRRSGELL